MYRYKRSSADNQHEQIVYKKGYAIDWAAFHRLQPGGWMNDAIIDFYFSKLQDVQKNYF